MQSTRHIGCPGPLRLRRLELGLRQVDVALAAGLSREHLSRLEVGHAKPKLDTAARLARALTCPVFNLFPLDDEASRQDGGYVFGQ